MSEDYLSSIYGREHVVEGEAGKVHNILSHVQKYEAENVRCIYFWKGKMDVWGWCLLVLQKEDGVEFVFLGQTETLLINPDSDFVVIAESNNEGYEKEINKLGLEFIYPVRYNVGDMMVVVVSKKPFAVVAEREKIGAPWVVKYGDVGMFKKDYNRAEIIEKIEAGW